jgi:tRNA-(ms[2]io[6]A)-hydroxylase
MRSTDIEAVRAFLGCPTPEGWIAAAVAEPALLLTDHANCEKKAAGTALNLLFRYSTDTTLMDWLSRLAREELRHFEQVLAIMRKRGIPFRPLAAARYAGGLRALVRTHEPAKLVDTLIAGAFIEARSCERFAAVAPWLDAELGAFYTKLLASESRHFRAYLSAAERAAGSKDISGRVAEFRAREAELIEAPDAEFRFHSGPMVASAVA